MALSNTLMIYLGMYLAVDQFMLVEGATSQQKRFGQIAANATCLSDHDLFVSVDVSKIRCASLCATYSGCRGVMFEPSTGKCHGRGISSKMTPFYGPGLDSVYYIDSFFYNGTWGTICDDGWYEWSGKYKDNNINVVCGMLGYAGGGAVLPYNTYRSSLSVAELPIWFDDVQCTGNELTIVDCQKRPAGSHDCIRHEDVNLVCYI